MKKILFLFICLAVSNCAFAINWSKVNVPSGRIAYVDMDSIVLHKNYYFYNVKMNSQKTNKPIVATIQSKKSNPLSATLKVYTLEEYNNLNGDYDNITSNMTTKLEPVTYDSLVYACFKKIKYFQDIKNLELQF